MIEVLVFIVGFALIAFLIFKFIKRLIFAVLSLLLLVVLIFGAFVGIIYFDYMHYTNFDEGMINFYCVEDADDLYGVSLEVHNGSFNFSDMRKAQSFKKVLKRDDQISFTVEKSVFYSLIRNETKYKLAIDQSGDNFVEMKLSKDVIVSVLESSEPEKLLRKSLGDEVVRVIMPYVEEVGDVKSFVFMLSIGSRDYDEREVKILAQAFDDEKINIVPQRLSVKLFRSIFPSSFLFESLDDFGDYSSNLSIVS